LGSAGKEQGYWETRLRRPAATRNLTASGGNGGRGQRAEVGSVEKRSGGTNRRPQSTGSERNAGLRGEETRGRANRDVAKKKKNRGKKRGASRLKQKLQKQFQGGST